MGRRLTPYERSQRERQRERQAAERRQKTANRRAAEKRSRDRQSAATSSKSKSLDKASRDAMDAIMNLHIEEKHPYLFLSESSAKYLAAVDMSPDLTMSGFVPKKTPDFTNHKKEIKKLKRNYNKNLKMSKFTIKEYLKDAGRSGFFIFWYLNKEADNYAAYLEKADKTAKLLKKDVVDAEKKLKDEQSNFVKSEKERKADFVASQQKDKERIKKETAKNDKNRIAWLKKLEKKDKTAIPQAIEIMYPLEFLYPSDVRLFNNRSTMDTIEVGFNITGSKMSLLVQLPHRFGFLPKEWNRLSRGGKNISTYVISDTERNNVFKSIVCSAGIAYLRSAFLVSSVSRLDLEVTVLGSDPMTGNPTDIVLLSLSADRPTVEGINFDKVDPTAAIKNFKSKFKPPKSRDKSDVVFESEVKSTINQDKLIWCDEEDSSIKGMDKGLIEAIKVSMIKLKGGVAQVSSPKKKKSSLADEFRALD